MIKRISIFQMLFLLFLIADGDFLTGVKATDLMLDRTEVPTAEDLKGISDWFKFYYNYSKYAVSVDGKWKSEDISSGVWITNLETSERKLIDDRGCQPKWSPTENLVVFLKRRVLFGKFYDGRQLYGGPELWICKSTGDNKTKLTSNVNVSEFMWSPDGEYICFEGAESPGGQGHPRYICVLNISTGEKTVVDTGSPYTHMAFSFSPSSKMVAYCKPLKWELKTEWWVTDAEIFIADIDGTEKTQITHTETVESMVKWCDDGRSLIVEQCSADPTNCDIPDHLKIRLKKQ